MIGLFVLLGKERTNRMTFKTSAISIGAGSHNHLALRDGNVADDHLKIALDDDEVWYITPRAPVQVAGRDIPPSTTPVRVNNGTRIRVGSYTVQLALQSELAMDPVEQRLLAAIRVDEDGSRMVYADWLEERGDELRAEFLRIQEVCANPPADLPADELEALPIRLRHIAVRVDEDWRLRVSRPAIEACRLVMELPCPKNWSHLTPTKDPSVRNCSTCKQQVFYCTTVAQAREHAHAGQCVALDPALTRSPNDLAPARRIPLAGRPRIVDD